MSRLLLLCMLLLSAPLFAQDNRFSDSTMYDAQVLSTSPLRVHYALHGVGRYRPIDFSTLLLDGQATLVYVYGPDNAMLHAPQVIIEPNQDYTWSFPQWRDDGGNSAISSVQPVQGDLVALQFQGAQTRPLLQSGFIVEFKPGVVYDPSRVRMQVVYLKKVGVAPHLDVFEPAPSIE